MSPSWNREISLGNLPPSLFSAGRLRAVTEKRFEDCKKETGPPLHPDWRGCKGPW